MKIHQNDDVYVMIVSDHGFGDRPCKEINLHSLLRQIGLVKVRKIIGAISEIYPIFRDFISYAPLCILKLLRMIHKVYRQKIDQNSFLNLTYVKSYGIYINKNINYDKIRQVMYQKLKKFKDPESGEQVFKYVFKKERIYGGPYLYQLPDVLFVTNPKYTVTFNIFTKKLFLKPVLLPPR